MRTEKVSIIILSYKSLEKTKKCIDSIKKFSVGIPYEIILVNNDASQSEAIQQLYSRDDIVITLEPWHNTYFAGGINLAVYQASGEYLALINDDAYFVDNSLEKMIHFLNKNRNYFWVTWNIYNDNEEKTLTMTATRLPSIPAEISRNTILWRIFKWIGAPKYYQDYMMLNRDREHEDADVEAWCDAFMLLRRKEFIEKGAYYNRLRLYYTEEDIGQKVRELGMKIRYLHDVKIMHTRGVATKKTPSSKILAIGISDRFWYFYKYSGIFTASMITFFSILWNPYILSRCFAVCSWLIKLSKEEYSSAKG